MKSVLKISALLVALSALSFGQCSLTDTQPVGVVAGGVHQFSAQNCGSNLTWSVSGDGTIDQNGNYSAPATVFVQNSARGAQNLPNDSVPNVPVQTWPVHPSSTQWLARWTSAGAQQSYFTIKLGAGPRYQKNFPIQHSDQSTPQQIWNAVYSVGNYQNVLAPLVQPPNAEMQAGLYMDPYGAAQQGTGPDRHNEDQEVLSNGLAIANEHYQLMPDSHNTACTPGAVTTCQFDTNLILPLPSIFRIQINGVTGACAGMNFNGTAASSFLATRVSEVPGSGYAYHVVMTLPYNSSACTSANFAAAYLAGSASNCAACNTGTMAQWQNWSDQSLRSTTAGGLPLQATSVDPNRWYSNVKNNLTDPSCKGSDGLPRVVANSHVVGFTLPNGMISPDGMGGSTTGNQVTGGHPRYQITAMSSTNPIQVTTSYNLGTAGLEICESPTPWLSVPATGSCSFHVRFQGLNGSCAALNENSDFSNNFYATSQDQYHFTIPVDGTSFQGCTFSPTKMELNTLTPFHENIEYVPAPAGSQFAISDWAPYGSVWRLDTTQLNPDSITDSFEKALLWEGACYGFVLDDGTNGLNDSLDSRINSSGFAPDELVTVATELSTLTVAPYLKIVDPAGTQPNPYSTTGNQFLTTNFRRTTVTVTGSAGSYSADVNLVGTAIGIGDQSERLPSIPAGGAYTPHIWVTGNVNSNYSCSFETPISGAQVTASGTITAPASVTALTAYKLKCTAAADPTVISYASGYFVPKAANGNIYLGIGQLHTSFTDTSGNVWWGQTTNRQWSGSGGLFQSPDGCDYCPLYGTFNENPSGWSGVTNGQLYGESISARNDAAEWIALPNGSYNVTVYGEAGLGVNAPGGSVYDVEVNGQAVDSWVDSYVRAGGTYHPYSKTYPVTVTNGVLSFIARDRQDTTAAVYGMSPFAAIQIAPASGPPPFTFNPPALPLGTQNVPYQAQIGGATGGIQPYHFTETGALPTGITLSTTGLLSGTTSETGQFPITVVACDAENPQICIPAPLTLTIQPASQPVVITSTTLAPGTVSVPYSQPISITGGTPPYTCASLNPATGGLKVETNCIVDGTPTTAGTFSFTVVAKDSNGSASQPTAIHVTINPLTAPVVITSPTTLPNGTVGKAYGITCPTIGCDGIQFAASGGVPGYTYAVVSGSVPGLTMSTSGLYSGKPTKGGTYNVGMQATDSKGNESAVVFYQVKITGSSIFGKLKSLLQ